MVNIVKPTSRVNPHSLAYGLPADVCFTPGAPAAAVAVGGTKLERATALIKQYPVASRQFILQLFIEQLSMSKAGAATYYTMLQKQREWASTKTEWKAIRSDWKWKNEQRKMPK